MPSDGYILWLQDCDRHCVSQVGGKCANLGEMIRGDVRVPPGFAITTAAYRHVLEQDDLRSDIQRLLAGLDGDDVQAIEQASQAIRRRMATATIPPAVEAAICAAYQQLADECGLDNPAVAVRSSATAEDLAGASFAGQQDTALWVRMPGSVMIHTALCWSSLFTPRAISYRMKMGFPHDQVQISVCVQKMVNARTAGVMFTLNPANGDRSKVAIDASWGLGETVVSGMVTPDNFLVDKVTHDILRRKPSAKLIEYVPDPHGRRAEIRDVPPERQNCLCLSDDEVLNLVELARRIEVYYGVPQDIEWAIDRDLALPSSVMTLQCRPETVWSRRPPTPVVKPQGGALDYVVANLLAGVKTRKD
jgi:pyruvate,water dikinase